MTDFGQPEIAMPTALSDDPRRQHPIKVKVEWQGIVNRLSIDGVLWAAVEWSPKRQRWCIEDAEGRCLSHRDHIHGGEIDKAAALTLAEEMIRNGTMPNPEQAEQTRKERLERRRQRPAEQRRRAARERYSQLLTAMYEAEFAVKEAPPLWEAISDALDLSDPELWRSNSFAAMRPSLILAVKETIAKVEYDLNRLETRAHVPGDKRVSLGARLARAREVLRQLETIEGVDDGGCLA
jgi:hypothetical protein